MKRIISIILLISLNISADVTTGQTTPITKDVTTGQTTPVNKIEYNPEMPHKVGIGKITIKTPDDIRYQLKDTAITLWPESKIRGGVNILGSLANGSVRTLLPSGDNLLDTGQGSGLGSLLDKENKLVLQPSDPTQYATVTISYQRSLDAMARMISSKIYIVIYVPSAKKYYTLVFDNGLFLKRLKKSKKNEMTLLEKGLLQAAADADKSGDKTRANNLSKQFATLETALKSGTWDLDQYFLNISFKTMGGTVHDDKPDLYHPVDIDSIDVSYLLYKGNAIEKQVATIPHDTLYQEPQLIDWLSDIPEGIAGKVKNGNA